MSAPKAEVVPLKTYSDLTQDEVNEILELYKSGTAASELVAAYTLKGIDVVYYIAHKSGYRKAPRSQTDPGASRREVAEELRAAQERVDELQRRLAELEISVERCADESSIIVHGVDKNFRVNGGMAKILAFITKTWPQTGGDV